MQYSAVQCSEVPFDIVYYTLHYAYYTILHYTILHYIILYYTLLFYVEPCTSLHYPALHRTALHCTANVQRRCVLFTYGHAVYMTAMLRSQTACIYGQAFIYNLWLVYVAPGCIYLARMCI